MKRTIILLSVGLCFGIRSHAQDTLFTSTVIKLYQAGFSSDLIIQEITARKFVKFGMFSPDTLALLNQKGVPNNIQIAMIRKQGGLPTSVAPTAAGSNPAPAAESKGLAGLGYGIYTKNGLDYKALQSTAVSSNRENSILHNNISSLIPSKITGVVVGPAAPISIKGTDTLYFVLRNNGDGMAGSSMMGATSPHDLVLMKMMPKKSTREIPFTKGRLAGQSEINPKDAIPFSSDQVTDGVFRVYVPAGLGKGQYCFIPASGMARIVMDKVYDFGVGE